MWIVGPGRVVFGLASLFLVGASCGGDSESVSTAPPAGGDSTLTAPAEGVADAGVESTGTARDATDEAGAAKPRGILDCDGPIAGSSPGSPTSGGPVDNASPRTLVEGMFAGTNVGSDIEGAIVGWTQRGSEVLVLPSGSDVGELTLAEALDVLPENVDPALVRVELILIDPDQPDAGTQGVVGFSLAENGWRFQGSSICASLLSDGPFITDLTDEEIEQSREADRQEHAGPTRDAEQLWEVVREEAEDAERNADVTESRIAQWEEQGAIEASAESLGPVSDQLLATASTLIPDARLFNTSAQLLEDFNGNQSTFQRFEFAADDGRYMNSVWLQTHESWGFSLADAARGRDEFSVVDGVETLVSRYPVVVHIQALDPTAQIMVSIVIEGGLGRPEALTGIDLAATEAALRDAASTRTD